MKKNLLLSCLLITALFTLKAQVIFDPATYDPGNLPAGMTIVEIEGVNYCQIILNAWESYISVDAVEAEEFHTDFTTTAKYSVGTSGFDISEINTFLKLANADFSVEIGSLGSASSAEFIEYTVPIAETGTVERIQVAGQETTGWSALVGDTLWIGTVSFVGDDPGGPDNLELTDREQFRIYPNPVNDELNLFCAEEIESIQIINIAGTVVRNITDVDLIHVADLTNGLYMIKVQTNSGVYSDTFIKE